MKIPLRKKYALRYYSEYEKKPKKRPEITELRVDALNFFINRYYSLRGRIRPEKLNTEILFETSQIVRKWQKFFFKPFKRISFYFDIKRPQNKVFRSRRRSSLLEECFSNVDFEVIKEGLIKFGYFVEEERGDADFVMLNGISESKHYHVLVSQDSDFLVNILYKNLKNVIIIMDKKLYFPRSSNTIGTGLILILTGNDYLPRILDFRAEKNIETLLRTYLEQRPSNLKEIRIFIGKIIKENYSGFEVRDYDNNNCEKILRLINWYLNYVDSLILKDELISVDFDRNQFFSFCLSET